MKKIDIIEFLYHFLIRNETCKLFGGFLKLDSLYVFFPNCLPISLKINISVLKNLRYLATFQKKIFLTLNEHICY